MTLSASHRKQLARLLARESRLASTLEELGVETWAIGDAAAELTGHTGAVARLRTELHAVRRQIDRLRACFDRQVGQGDLFRAR